MIKKVPKDNHQVQKSKQKKKEHQKANRSILEYLVLRQKDSQLNNENKILGSYATTGLGGTDHGGFGFGFVPKDDSQSFDEAENLILEEIKKVKSGDFSDDLIRSVKLNMSMDHETRMESVDGRTWLIMSTILDNMPWEDVKNYPNRVNAVTKDDVVEIANKYFTDNYLMVRSDKGDNKKVKLENLNIIEEGNFISFRLKIQNEAIRILGCCAPSSGDDPKYF